MALRRVSKRAGRRGKREGIPIEFVNRNPVDWDRRTAVSPYLGINHTYGFGVRSQRWKKGRASRACAGTSCSKYLCPNGSMGEVLKCGRRVTFRNFSCDMGNIMTKETWVTMWWNMGRVESSSGKRALFVWGQHETPRGNWCSQSKIEGGFFGKGVMWKPIFLQASKRNAGSVNKVDLPYSGISTGYS